MKNQTADSYRNWLGGSKKDARSTSPAPGRGRRPSHRSGNPRGNGWNTDAILQWALLGAFVVLLLIGLARDRGTL